MEFRLHNLRKDIQAIVESECQTDPTFKTTQIYRRISAAEVYKQLVAKGYAVEDLPTTETIRGRLNEMGYRPKKVQKARPKKRSPRPMRSSPR